MVTPLRSGASREVDVVITASVAGHAVSVGVEASTGSRPATVEWVERMIGKHGDLPTNKLVLFSGNGFTPAALEKAWAHGIAAISAADVVDNRADELVLNGLERLWMKTIQLTPDQARVFVARPDATTAWFKAPADLHLFNSEGESLGPALYQAVVHGLREHLDSSAQEVFRDVTSTWE